MIWEWIHTLACKNRLENWYFRLGEWHSPERDYQGNHPCSCAKSRLGEVDSPERDGLSPRPDFLAWARVPAVDGLEFCFNEWIDMKCYNYVYMLSCMLEICYKLSENLWSVKDEKLYYNGIWREIHKSLLVCVRTWGIRIGWLPETPIIIHAHVE